MTKAKLYHLASFSVGSEGGNPAGVWIGEVEVTARQRGTQMEASLRSVDTRQEMPADDMLQEALDCLGWKMDVPQTGGILVTGVTRDI